MFSSKYVLHFLIGNVSVSFFLSGGTFLQSLPVQADSCFPLNVFLHTAQAPVRAPRDLGVL